MIEINICPVSATTGHDTFRISFSQTSRAQGPKSTRNIFLAAPTIAHKPLLCCAKICLVASLAPRTNIKFLSKALPRIAAWQTAKSTAYPFLCNSDTPFSSWPSLCPSNATLASNKATKPSQRNWSSPNIKSLIPLLSQSQHKQIAKSP